MSKYLFMSPTNSKTLLKVKFGDKISNNNLLGTRFSAVFTQSEGRRRLCTATNSLNIFENCTGVRDYFGPSFKIREFKYLRNDTE